MEYPCMLSCRFPSTSKAAAAASRSEFRCPQKYITPFKFLGWKISIPLCRGNNPPLFSVRPTIKRDSVQMTVAAAANKGGGMEDEKGKKMQPKGKLEGICFKLVERDRNACNLGQKLEIIQDLVAENIDNEKRLEALTYSAIYLKCISKGQTWSEELKKYARICWHIFCHLEKICSRKDISVQEILVIRKIRRCLSPLKEFTASVPVTRTEDVAHQELEDFFNVGSLEKLLESIRDSLDQSSAALPRFLISKQQLDDIEDTYNAQDKLISKLMSVLQALDNLRQEIMKGLEIKHQNYSSDAAIAMRLKRRLCEIGLEDYSSLLLSRLLKALGDVGGAENLAKNVKQKNVCSWSEPLGALVIGIHQLGLSGWEPEECRAIGNELIAWGETSLLETEGGEDGMRIWGLRLKATLDRAQRLTEDFSKTLLDIFHEKVQNLGEAFEILENSSNTFAEAEIGADVVSNLCTLLWKAVRKAVGARGWDILLPGTTFGKFITENIVVVTCEDDEEGDVFKIRTGEVVRLVAPTESAPPVKAFEVYLDRSNNIGLGTMRVQDAEERAKLLRVPMTENICGAKAAACCRLASLAAESIQVKNDLGVPAFKVPKGAVIPFSSIRRALDREAKRSCYDSLIESIAKATTQDKKATTLDELHDLVSSLSPSEEDIKKLSEIFPVNARLVVRSSSCFEDLRGVDVAGKDEPILNTSLSNPSLLKDAISRVWASLYTPEAFRSLQAAPMALKDADMAVLVQEMLSPDLSFMLHIASPSPKKMMFEGSELEIEDGNDPLIDVEIDEKKRGRIEVEIAPGLEEALGVDTRASPWRLSYDKSNGTVETLAFANMSEELVVRRGEELVKVTVDYSKKPLTTDADFRQQLGRRLGAVGLFLTLTEKFPGPWDVVGRVVGEDIYIVQMRPRAH